MTTRITILDDYQHIALESADWQGLEPDCEITVFNDWIDGEDAVVAAIGGFDVVVAMRERTPFPATLIDRLPNLKLLVTTGMRNLAIDMEAARARGLPVCGTALLPYPAFEHAWALIMACMKQIPAEGEILTLRGPFAEAEPRRGLGELEGASIISAEDGKLVLSTRAGGSDAVELLSRVLAGSLPVEGVSVQTPSLNGLFLKLTGRELRD